MRLLLDTHVFLWYISADPQLPVVFRDAIEEARALPPGVCDQRLCRLQAAPHRQALDLAADDAEWLRDRLLEAVKGADAEKLDSDAMGQRWRVDVAITRHDRRAVVRTLWIMRTGETVARFVTCWVL